METILKNENCYVQFHQKSEYNHKPYIIVKDLKDIWNEQTAYTQKIRGIELAWKFIQQLFTVDDLKDDINFREITNILDEKFNLDTHYYCAID